MSEVWVVNASPLIALAKIGRLDVLADAGREIVVPSAVAREVLAGPADDAASAAVRGPLARLVVEHLDLASVIEWGLGAGERRFRKANRSEEQLRARRRATLAWSA